jgi:hypothetical protein
MSEMKIENLVRNAALSILFSALFLAATGCGGYGTSGGGGGGGTSPSITSLTPSSGPVGTSVTIYGSNFGASQGTSTLQFNGTAAAPTSWSATNIVAPVPAGATTGNVVVTVGGAASPGMLFTVPASSAPSITSLNPTSGPVGTSVTITGNNFGASQGMSTVTFSGTAAPPTGWSATSITAQVPTGATTGNVVVTIGGVPSNGVGFTVTTTTSASSWTYVQDSLGTYCVGNSTTCTMNQGNIVPTTAGTVWAVVVGTTNNVTISSVTGGGGSWQLCGAPCHVFQSSPIPRALDMAYNLTGNPGTGSVTINLSGNSGTVFGANFIELLPPAGSTASFDIGGATSAASCSVTCTGVGLSISATDAIVQVIDANAPAAWNSWSAPYTSLPLGEAVYLDATNGTAPTVAVRTPANGGVFTAFAFKSTAGSFTPKTKPISAVNFTGTGTAGTSCSPTCTISIPSTGAGNLLFIEAANLNNNFISSVSGGGIGWVIPTGANSCRISYVLSGSNALSCAYLLSSTAGTTSISITMTGSGAEGFAIWEVTSTAGSFSFDTMNSASNSANFSPTGAPLTLTGTNDAVFQAIFVPGGTSSGSYLKQPRQDHMALQFLNAEAAEGGVFNVSSAPAVVWVNQQNNATVVTGIAFSVQ